MWNIIYDINKNKKEEKKNKMSTLQELIYNVQLNYREKVVECLKKFRNNSYAIVKVSEKSISSKKLRIII